MLEEVWENRILRNEDGYFLAECFFNPDKPSEITRFSQIGQFYGYETKDEIINEIFAIFKDIIKGERAEIITHKII